MVFKAGTREVDSALGGPWLGGDCILSYFLFLYLHHIKLCSDSGDVPRILSDMSMAKIESEDSSKKEKPKWMSSEQLSSFEDVYI